MPHQVIEKLQRCLEHVRVGAVDENQSRCNREWSDAGDMAVEREALE